MSDTNAYNLAYRCPAHHPMPLPLIALALVAFGIGTSEYVMVGLLPNVAIDLGVTIDVAGLLISGYALGVVVGAPLMAIVTARLPRNVTLIGLASSFILGNLLCAIAPTYGLLMAARVITAFCHGAFFGIGAVVAAQLAPRQQRASAIALMFTGLTLANVLGVPLGTLFGQTLGWRATFWATTVISLAAVLALAAWLPKHIPGQAHPISREFRVLRNIRVLWPLLASTLASASLFCVFTYIAPILRELTGVSERGVTGMLLWFGIALTLGSALGGKLGDQHLEASLRSMFVGIIVVVAAFAFALHSLAFTLLTMFLWGVLAFALVPLLQTLIVEHACAAPNLASTLNQGAFNLGNACGAWLASIALGQGLSLSHLPWISIALSLAALLLTLWGTRYYGRGTALH